MTKTKKIHNMNKKHTRKNKYTKKAHKLKKRVKRTRKSKQKRRFRKRKTVRKFKRGGDNDDCNIEGFIEKNELTDNCHMCRSPLNGLPADINSPPSNTDIRGGIVYKMKNCNQKFHAKCLLCWMKLIQHQEALEENDKIKCPGGCNYSNIDQNTYKYIFAFIGTDDNIENGKGGSKLYNGGKYFTKEYLGNAYTEQIADFKEPSRDSTTPPAPPAPPAPDSTTPPPPSDSNCVIMG
jgi:hypothetical protein